MQAEGEIGKPGGTLTYASQGDPKTFNTVLVKESTSGVVLGYVFDGLTETNGITTKVEPALAEKWMVSPDGKSYTFTLRDGLQWSDGQPVTADDVLFTFNQVIANEKIPTTWRDPISIDGKLPKVEKIDARTVKFTTVKPFAPFIRSVGGTQILPKHVLGKTLVPDSNGNPRFNQFWGLDSDVKTIVGTGPFMVEAYVPGQRVVMKRNPLYWRVDKAGNRLPYLDRLVILTVKDTDTMLLKFRAQETDLHSLRPNDYPLMKPGEQAGNYKILKGGTGFGMVYITFNLKTDKNAKGQYFVDPIKQKWFNDKRFRQAVAYAIDQHTLIHNFFNDMGEPEVSVESKSSPFFNPHVKRYSYDLPKAAQLLREAGFKKFDETLQDAGGHPVEFVVACPPESSLYLHIVNVLIADLAKLGMKVTLQELQFNSMIKQVNETMDWQAVVMGFTRTVEPNDLGELWESTKSQHLFRMGEKKPETPWEAEIDRLFEAGLSVLNEHKRKPYYERFQEIALDQVPLVLFPNFLELEAVRNTVGNVRFSSYNYQGGTIGNIWDMYKKS